VVTLGLVLPPGARERFTATLGRVESFTRWPGWVLAALLFYTLTRWFGLC
jgi:hypothetical protein